MEFRQSMLLPMPHEPRLTRALRELLQSHRVAALGTLHSDGSPSVSMVPFAIEPHGGLVVIHVSSLAAHSQNMQMHPQVSLMVMQAEVANEPVHALPRVTLYGMVSVLEPQTAAWAQARTAYLARFPEAEPMTELGDFRFMGITVHGARQIAGFGAARSISPEELMDVLHQK